MPLALLCALFQPAAPTTAIPNGDDDFPGRRVDTPGMAARVVVQDGLAYVADKSAGLQIIDVTDPETLRIVGSVATPDANGVTLANGLAFVADGDLGLVVIDVRQPAAAQILSMPNPCRSYDVAVNGDYAHLAVFGGLQVFDIRNPAAPAYVGDVDWMSTVRAVVTSGAYAYYGCSRRGVRIFDITDPTRPALVREVDTPGVPHALVLAGDHLFVADGSGGLVVVDVTDPTRATQVGAATTSGLAAGVAVSGLRAYVGLGADGLEVFDISTPAQPVAITKYTSLAETGGIGVIGDDVVAADGAAGLVLLQDRAEANLSPRCDAGGPYTGAIGQRIRFEASGSKDPDGTLTRFEWDFGDGIMEFGPAAVHAYAQPGVYVARLCIADDDGVLSCCETQVDLRATAVDIAFEVTSRDDAVLLEWELTGARRVVECRIHRRVTGGDDAFVSLGVVPPTSRGADRQRFEFRDASVEVDRTYTYRVEVRDADGSSTFAEREIRVEAGAAPRIALHAATPNPFNPSTRIAFELPRPGAARLTVYDAAGRRVRRLLDAHVADTRHAVVWDGRDDQGAAVRSGVYVVRLSAAGAERSRKLVLLE